MSNPAVARNIPDFVRFDFTDFRFAMIFRLLPAFLIVLLATPAAAQFQPFPNKAYWREQWQRAPLEVDIEAVGNLADYVIDGKVQLSLRAYVELVMANHPDINIQKLSVSQQENAIQRALSPFDPNFTSTFAATRSTTPSNDLLQGANVRSTLTQLGRATYTQTFDTGTQFSVGYITNRRADNSTLVTFNPSITQTMQFNLDQPLLQGRGRSVQRIPVMVAESRLGLQQEQVRQQVIQVLFQAEQAYWAVVSARERLKVQENNLELARAFLERSRRELELGAISPLDIYQPEQQFATAQVGVTQARYQLQQAEDAVRRQIAADLHPDVRNLPLVLTESAEPPTDPPTFEPEQTVEMALANRPEVQQRRRNLQIDDLQIRQATNNLRPDLALNANYSAQGRGGPFRDRSFLGSGSQGQIIPGGLPDALDQLFGFGFPTYAMGLTLRLPLRNRRAAADLSDASIRKKQDMYQLRSIEQDIRLDVLQAISGLEQAKASIQQAAVARDFAQKRLDAEQKKYDLGVNTAFIVLDAQDRLLQSEADLLNQSIAYRRALLTLYRATGDLLQQRGVTLKYD